MPVIDPAGLGGDYRVQGLRSLEAFRAWAGANPWFMAASLREQIVEEALAVGIESRYLGPVSPRDVRCASPNYRESLLARGLNPRQRAVLDLLTAVPGSGNPDSFRIYAPEAVTCFALALRGRFSRFLGSEYAPDAAAQRAQYPIPHQDLAALTLPDGAFDLVVANEVFEHVPDLPAALREICRVLASPGLLLATFPFLAGRERTLIKARREADRIEYLAEPEYHENPRDPSAGSLVYRLPGWDIVETIEACGFGDVEMVVISSIRAGITAADAAGIFVLAARKH